MRAIAALAAILLGASCARADGDVPGGHLYAGVGAYALSSAAGRGFGLSLEGQIEVGRVLVGGMFLLGRGGEQSLAFVGPRLGVVLLDGPVYAPYVALGVGTMAEGDILDEPVQKRALMPEVGLELFRGNRFGRVTIAAWALLPTSHAFRSEHSDDRLDDWYGLGVRLFL